MIRRAVCLVKRLSRIDGWINVEITTIMIPEQAENGWNRHHQKIGDTNGANGDHTMKTETFMQMVRCYSVQIVRTTTLKRILGLLLIGCLTIRP